jgi:hypothetical protein
MRQIQGILTTMLMLIALYLVLRHGANASRVISSIATGASEVFTTLQGRNQPRRRAA